MLTSGEGLAKNKFHDLGVCSPPVPVNWEKVGQSVVRYDNLLKSGQGVVISPRLIMTALHGLCDVGTGFEITSIDETTRKGVVAVACFESWKVDIALLRLEDGQPPFKDWFTVMTRSPVLLEKVSFVALLDGIAGGLGLASIPTKISGFEPCNTLCRAPLCPPFMGSGVITSAQPDGSVLVVGVRVAPDEIRGRRKRRNKQTATPASFVVKRKRKEEEKEVAVDDDEGGDDLGHADSPPGSQDEDAWWDDDIVDDNGDDDYSRHSGEDDHHHTPTEGGQVYETAGSYICIANLVPEIMTEIELDRSSQPSVVTSQQS